MDRLENWLELRARKGRSVAIDPIARQSRPRAIRRIPGTRRLLADVRPETLQRIQAFESRMPQRRTWNTIIDTLLNEALDARLFFLHPGTGNGRKTNYELE